MCAQFLLHAAQSYVALLEAHGTQTSTDAVGRPTENAYAGWLLRTLKEEDAYHRIGHFLDDVYMTKGVHSALGHLTPSLRRFMWPNR